MTKAALLSSLLAKGRNTMVGLGLTQEIVTITAAMCNQEVWPWAPRTKAHMEGSPCRHPQECNCLCFNRCTMWPCEKRLLGKIGAAGGLITFYNSLCTRHFSHFGLSELLFNSSGERNGPLKPPRILLG